MCPWFYGNPTRLRDGAPCHLVEESVSTCWSSTWEPMAFERQSRQRIMHVENHKVVDQFVYDWWSWPVSINCRQLSLNCASWTNDSLRGHSKIHPHLVLLAGKFDHQGETPLLYDRWDEGSACSWTAGLECESGCSGFLSGHVFMPKACHAGQYPIMPVNKAIRPTIMRMRSPHPGRKENPDKASRRNPTPTRITRSWCPMFRYFFISHLFRWGKLIE